MDSSDPVVLASRKLGVAGDSNQQFVTSSDVQLYPSLRPLILDSLQYPWKVPARPHTRRHMEKYVRWSLERFHQGQPLYIHRLLSLKMSQAQKSKVTLQETSRSDRYSLRGERGETPSGNSTNRYRRNPQWASDQ